MAYETHIPYVDSTFNPVWGCSHVSSGCLRCPGENDAKRHKIRCFGEAPRKEFSYVHWREPVRWDIEAGAMHRTRTVLCGDHCDIFDTHWPDGTRERLWGLEQVTTRLFWLNLTKRIENARKMLPRSWLEREFPANIGMGVTVEEKKYLRRLDKLSEIPSSFRWLRAEPMLGPIRLKEPHWFLSFVVVGACRDTKPKWMLDLMVDAIEQNIPVYLTRNSTPPTEVVRELPDFRRILISGLIDQRQRHVFPRMEMAQK